LQSLLNQQTGSVAKTINNLNAVTGNLAANSGRITSTLTNLDSTSAKMARLDLEKTLGSLDATIQELHSTLSALNKDTGTVGKLLYDPTLYKNLTATSNKLNILMDDIRINPKRYFSFSMFREKQRKDNPLMEPLPDSLNAPYKK
jgi:phospholipid/cholesterol/gamma-HCH transport system substrate-binding protein